MLGNLLCAWSSKGDKGEWRPLEQGGLGPPNFVALLWHSLHDAHHAANIQQRYVHDSKLLSEGKRKG
jgi:hypothetical protein